MKLKLSSTREDRAGELKNNYFTSQTLKLSSYNCRVQHTQVSLFLFICCFTSRSTARVILRRVVYRWRKPVHTAL